MKTKIFALIAAFFMLMGGSAWAQADVKGDVNGDGVVNEQDIAAILAIMQEAGGVKEKTKYYWYVGQENPASMTSIGTTVESGFGWREIGTSLGNYGSLANCLYNGNVIDINLDEEKYYWYLLLPVNCKAIPRDGAGTDASLVGICEKQGTKTINGVEYQIYKSCGEAFAFDTPIY
ncbi:MAG: hypothetical protein J6S02_01980 [Bacteroidaceae bacterium]|nr:hypothetical protein [Bacteroidaceae bacterium]